MLERYVQKQVIKDLAKKMVFVGGPRQVGKTTMAKKILPKLRREYFNWDNTLDRRKLLKMEFSPDPLLILDEIHKYKKWRNFIKGIYDSLGEEKKILVTGSARLDYYRFGGDSLQGRYFYLRLLPLSVAELKISTHSDFLELLRLGGFPEPFFTSSATEADRWSRDYAARFIHEDLQGLENVDDIGSLELLYHRLPDCVGSPLSLNSLREDLQIHHTTVKRYVDIAERLYSIFRLSPLGLPQIKAVKKEQKHYHMDWNLIESAGARFENLVAVHLLKYVDYLQDTEARKIELRYFRDRNGREVDFVIVERKEPIIAIECKYGDDEESRSLRYLKSRFPKLKAYQLSATGKKDVLHSSGVRKCPAWVFLKGLV